MLSIIIEGEAAMGEAKHAAVVRVLAREQASAAGRAGGGCAKCLAEQNSLLRETLKRGRRDGMAVWLHVASCVVRMNVENIRAIRCHVCIFLTNAIPLLASIIIPRLLQWLHHIRSFPRRRMQPRLHAQVERDQSAEP